MRPSPRERASYASRRVSERQSSKSTQSSRWKWAANWPDLHAAMMTRFAGVFAALEERFAIARVAGEAHPEARADDLVRMAIGAVISGLLLTPSELDDAWVARMADSLHRGVRP